MVDEENHKSYAGYLLQRSRLGRLYRNWLLYPRINASLRGKVLDVGCGIGDFLNSGRNSTGVDINKYNVAYCKALGLDAEWIQDGHIPFENDSFTSVVLDNVLEHIPATDVDATMDEIARVLQPEGIVVVGVPGIKGYHSDPDHKVFYAEDDLRTLFDRHDFTVVRTFRMPLPWLFLEKYLSQYCLYAVFQSR